MASSPVVMETRVDADPADEPVSGGARLIPHLPPEEERWRRKFLGETVAPLGAAQLFLGAVTVGLGLVQIFTAPPCFTSLLRVPIALGVVSVGAGILAVMAVSQRRLFLVALKVNWGFLMCQLLAAVLYTVDLTDLSARPSDYYRRFHSQYTGYFYVPYGIKKVSVGLTITLLGLVLLDLCLTIVLLYFGLRSTTVKNLLASLEIGGLEE